MRGQKVDFRYMNERLAESRTLKAALSIRN